jgi:hypothetical protein
MFILQQLLTELKNALTCSRKGKERGIWFVYILIAIVIPFTSSKNFKSIQATGNTNSLANDSI